MHTNATLFLKHAHIKTKKKVTHYNHIYIYNNKQQKVAIEFNFN